MTEIKFDLSLRGNKIKRMNAVNNGPTSPGVRNVPTNFDAYKALEIPYARNHDASFYTPYGGEHIVDVHRIFKDFSADENDPESYIFEPTDKYLQNTINAGTKIFYRLGASIEHGYKYGTRVPRDFAKWARICEHIIRHYNEGWANGFEWGIDYWEIWNEPDCRNADGSNPCWQGTEEQFIEFYTVAAKHLKKCFPNIKVGGPAFASVYSSGFNDRFLDSVVRLNTPLDFYSYHWYGKNIGYDTEIEDGLKVSFADCIKAVRDQLDSKGLTKTETVLNEWNYIYGWSGESWAYSLRSEKNLKGASFALGAMCAAQAGPLDMLMYYDARPCGMNGLFATNTYKCLKPYYSFAAFNELVKLGTEIPCELSAVDIYSCAATNGKDSAVVLTYFKDDESSCEREVKVSFAGKSGKKRVICCYLDEMNDLEPIREEIFTADEFSLYLKMPLYTSVLIKIEGII